MLSHFEVLDSWRLEELVIPEKIFASFDVTMTKVLHCYKSMPSCLASVARLLS